MKHLLNEEAFFLSLIRGVGKNTCFFSKVEKQIVKIIVHKFENPHLKVHTWRENRTYFTRNINLG